MKDADKLPNDPTPNRAKINKMNKQQSQEPAISDVAANLYEAINNPSGKIELHKVFHQLLNRAKREKGIYATEISRETGVSASIISGFRRGKQGMTIDSFEKVVNYVLLK